mgnify:FL=1
MKDENVQDCCKSCGENGVCDKDLSAELLELSKVMRAMADRILNAGYCEKGEEMAGAAGIAKQWAGAILEQGQNDEND